MLYKNKSIKFILWGWVVFLLIVNAVWLSLDKNPPAWDQAAHLRSIILANQWLSGKFWGNFVNLIKVFGGYPPLIYIIGGVWSCFVGVSLAKITFLNTLFLVAGIIGVNKLAEELTKDKRIALLSGIIFSLLPVIGDISRNMLLDLALLVWVVWGLFFWIKSDGLRINKYSWGLLIMLILASLTKLNGFIYFVPMGAVLLIENFKDKKFWMKMVIGGAVYIVTVGWWWIINSVNIYQYLTGLAGKGEEATDPMNLLAWRTWIHYLRLFFLNQVGPIVAMVFVVSFGFVPKDRNNKKLIWWTVMTYIIFTVIKNKDFRFTLPLLIMVAIWMGWGLYNKSKSKIGKLLLGGLLLWMGFNFWENGFNWPIKKPFIVSTPTFLMGDVNWINFSDYPVREFRRVIWPDEKILNDLPNNKIKLLVVMNVAELNDNTLGMYKLMIRKDNLEIHGVDRWGSINFDYVLLPDLKTESAPFYDTQLKIRKEVMNNIWSNIQNYQEIGKYVLPNGGIVYLLKI